MSMVNKALVFGLDMAEKVKPELEILFKNQYEEFLVFKKEENERKALEASS